ncbi:MAG TPA: hypothetical protein PKN50_01690 [Spirochaetota bacterium]|nr:hypothetical protein [Spirochaetota bacterium]HPV39645.1 hypothetical protein [Spirochaetota bacterium]
MQERYELIYGYKHCKKDIEYSAGFADSEEEAAEWVRKKSLAADPAEPLPGDPFCDCEVSFCPMKFQRPWYSYRRVPT